MLIVFFVGAAVVLSVYALLYVKHKAHMKRFKNVPGIHPITVVGNLYGLIRLYSRKLMHHPGVYILQGTMGNNFMFHKEGLQVFWLGTFPVVSIFKPELLELILSSTTSLEKSYEYTYLHKWLGLGLLTSTGSKWKSRRRLLTPCFHFRILEDFLPTFNDNSLILARKLRTLQNEEYVDTMSLMVLCTLDIVCETVMGARIGAQTGENPEYVKAVHNLSDVLMERITRPLLWSDFLFNLSKAGKAFNRDLKILHNFTDKIIKKKKTALLAQCSQGSAEQEDIRLGGKKRQALMDLLLDQHVNGQQLTEEDIREEVDTFMFEGHDTTAMAMTFSLYCIGLYPEVQRKIHEELDSIFGEDTERPVTLDDIRDMKYLECVIKESLRLYPSVPTTGRILNEELKFNGIVIPKGTSLNLFIISLHRNPEIYPNPEIFDPDRFTPDNIRKRHPFAYLPFSAGPRNCIGQKFALLEEKVVIANILRNFTLVSLDPRDKVHLKMEFVLRSSEPIRIKLIARILPRRSRACARRLWHLRKKRITPSPSILLFII
ncbi:cytochrome P450 4c3 [Trichonephila clavata]|uniref:Cytochrome P450 4c3 n=1 Tax=Trichonephila clavata TaxID=2740835 RepID=A0A8X6HKL7_TRICU|nr:cytochrome P450 4c3 [Trichonephila clavata]